MSVKSKKWLPMDYILNNLTGQQQIRALERKTRYYCEDRREQRMKDKLAIADNIMDGLSMKGTQREEVKQIIKYDYPNLKVLLNNHPQNVIIACICFFVLTSYKKNVKLEDYRVINRLNLDYEIYSKFLTNLVIEARKLMRIRRISDI